MNNFKAIVCSTFVFSVFLVITNLHAAGIANSTADNPTNKGFYRQLEGTIGNAKVEMVLTKIGNQLSGSYFYTKYKTEISLMPPDNEDNVAEDGSFTLNEYVTKDGEETHTGTFTGKLLPDGSITGTWKSADGKKIFPFELVKMLSTDSAEISIEYYSYPFYLIYEGSIDTVIKNKKVTIKQKSSKMNFEDSYELPIITKLPSGNNEHLTQINKDISQAVLDDVQSSKDRSGKTIIIDLDAPIEPGEEIEIIEKEVFNYYFLNKHNILSIIICNWLKPHVGRSLRTETVLNFNLKTGNKITFDDVFKKGSEDKVYKIISNELKSHFDSEDIEDYVSIDIEHFAITEKEIIFMNTEPDFRGIPNHVETEVPIDKLRHLLKPDGIITW